MESNIFIFVKWSVIIEIILLVILILLNYGVYFYQFSTAKKIKDKKSELENSLVELPKNELTLNSKLISQFKKNISIVLDIISDLDSRSDLPNWKTLRDEIIKTVLIPNAKKMAKSKNWFNRYIAVRIFQYDSSFNDESILLELINDPVLLVSINAAKIAANFPTSQVINAMITHYSEGRHLQQAMYSDVLSKVNGEREKLSAIILERLERETNIYVKVFCYKLLSKLPSKTVTTMAKTDLQIDNVELKIAVLNYLEVCDHEHALDLIREYADDPHWEIRTVAIKLLGVLKDVQSISLLEKHLKDPEYWVRINAGQALVKIGEPGLAVLKSQNPNEDRFAYETAAHLLTTLQNVKGENRG